MEKKGILKTEKGFYCYIDGQYYTSLYSLIHRLRALGTNSKEYYDKYLGEVGKCANCGKPTRYEKISKGYRKFCSISCAKKSEEHRKIVSERFIGHPEKLAKALEKTRKTMSSKSKEELNEINDRRVKTLKERYGDDYASRKTKLQWERRTQEDIDALVAKSNATKKKNGTLYVVPYKSSNKKIVINGITFKVQGYEDIALNLLSEIIDVNKIKVGKEVPKILLTTGKNYYPDICIDNLLIEVKSEYTYSVEEKENLLKQRESIKAGFNHIFLVIHSKDLTKKRVLKDKNKYLKILHKAIISQASKEEGSTTIPVRE